MRRLTFYLRRSSLAFFVVLLSMGATTAQTTAFKYQGQLPDDYNQPTAPYDIQFNLYDEVTGSNPPLNAAPLVLDDVQVTNGSFAVSLDFGNLFDGSNRYLEIGVRREIARGRSPC